MSDPQDRLKEIEAAMADASFWNEKEKAQEVLREFNDLKQTIAEKKKYDSGHAIITIFAGAGGDDAEDFARMLYKMYEAYAYSQKWFIDVLAVHDNPQGGFRNITFEVVGERAYGLLKNESGVHRLVRLSPFNAKSQRHTSFAMVEVVPKFPKVGPVEIPDDDLEIDFTKSGGPGGQNVNKRETAVRVVHTPTGLSVHADGERSQAQNKEKALEILRGKIFKLREDNIKKEAAGLSVSKDTSIEWGNQIRSYVLHPYQMVKDHRTDVEISDVKGVLEDGEITPFLEAEKEL